MNVHAEQVFIRLGAASRGPWSVDQASGLVVGPEIGGPGVTAIAQCEDELDARFIANARLDVQLLLNRLSVIERVCEARIEAAERHELDRSLADEILALLSLEPVEVLSL